VIGFLQFVLLGMAAGGVYALVSLSVVTVYRGSGIINFAAGGFALLGASLYYELSKYMSAWPAVILAVLLCGAGGLIVQLGVMYPMRRSAPIVRVVATLGIMAILANAGDLRYGANSTIFVPSFLPNGVVHFGTSIGVGDAQVIVFIVGLVVIVALQLVYRYTAFGRLTTGVAENERATAALGWSPQLIAAVNWSLGGLLAGLGGILLVPIAGFVVSPLVLVVIPALSAALIGGFRSFPLAFLGAELVGVLESLSTKYIQTPGWSSAVPFIVIIVLLVARGRALPLRSHFADRLPRIGSAGIQWRKVVPWTAVSIGSLFLFTNSWALAVSTSVYFAFICLSIVVVLGYGGQISLAQISLAGIGALAATRVAAVFGVPFLPALLIGVVAAVASGLVVALPALRVRGVNLAVITLGLAEVITAVVLSNPSYTGGVFTGTVVPPAQLFGWNISFAHYPQRYAAVEIVLLVLCTLMVANIRRGRTGRRLLSVRSNERGATSIGISVMGAKLYAFGVSAALAAVGGVLIGFQYANVDFTQFDVLTSVQSVVLAVIGGVGFISGAAFGGGVGQNGLFQEILNHWINVSGGTFALVLSFVIVPTLILQPDGAIAALRETREKIGDALRRRLGRDRRAAPVTSAGRPPTAGPVPSSEPVPAARAASYRVSPLSLEVRDLRVRYGATVAVDGVDLVVNPGEVVGLIGANGAGKTTFIDAVTGFTGLDRGQVILGGSRIGRLSARRRARRGLTRSFQSLELFDDLSVEDNLRAASEPRDVVSYFRDLIWPVRPPRSEIVELAIRAFELGPWLKHMPDELPYAQRRLVGLARAVATGPSVLMLDEPAAGLDTRSTEELARLIRSLAADWGMAVLLVEHDVAMVLSASDRVYALDFGRVIMTGTPQEVRHDARVISAYLGKDEDEAPASQPVAPQFRPPVTAVQSGDEA